MCVCACVMCSVSSMCDDWLIVLIRISNVNIHIYEATVCIMKKERIVEWIVEEVV